MVALQTKVGPPSTVGANDGWSIANASPGSALRFQAISISCVEACLESAEVTVGAVLSLDSRVRFALLN